MLPQFDFLSRWGVKDGFPPLLNIIDQDSDLAVSSTMYILGLTFIEVTKKLRTAGYCLNDTARIVEVTIEHIRRPTMHKVLYIFVVSKKAELTDRNLFLYGLGDYCRGIVAFTLWGLWPIE